MTPAKLIGRLALGCALAIALPSAAQAMTVIHPQPGDSTRLTRPVFTFSGAQSVDEAGDHVPGFACQIDSHAQPTPCDSGWVPPVPLANGPHYIDVSNVAEGNAPIRVNFTIDPNSPGVTDWALPVPAPPPGGTPPGETPPPGTPLPPGTPAPEGAPPGAGLIIGPQGTVIYNAPSRISIVSRYVHVSRAGKTTVKLTCGAGIGSCGGTLSLTKRMAVRVSKTHVAQRTVRLGTARFTIASAHSLQVKVTLNSRARALLRHSDSRALVVRTTATTKSNVAAGKIEYSLL